MNKFIMKTASLIFKKYSVILLLLFFLVHNVNSQEVGIGTDDPQSTLDIRAINHNGAVSETDGVLVPRVNSLGVAGSQNGQLVYLIADSGNLKKGFYNWNGTTWTALIFNSSSEISNTVVMPDAVIPIPSTSFTVSPNTPINDNSAYNTLIPVSGIAGNVTRVTITINITHTYDGDLDLFLRSPASSNRWLELSTDNGGGGDGFTNTIFNDSAPTNITAGTAPFTGSYRPEGTLTSSGAPVNVTANITNLAGFNGINPNGDWAFRVGDDAGGDQGTLNSVTLSISGSTSVDWVLIGEVSIAYFENSATIIKSSYSADPSDSNGVITSITRTTVSAGTTGTTAATLPGTVLNFVSASATGAGNYWVNTFNQARDIGLTDNTLYYYQLWRQGNIESPINLNETFSLIPMRLRQ